MNEFAIYLERNEQGLRVDEQGHLTWAKNGEPVDTSKFYTDSEDGIFPVSDEATPCVNSERCDENEDKSIISSQYSASDASEYSADGKERADKYVNVGKNEPASQSTPTAIMNRLLRKTTRPNTWIFVSDTRFRLYIGIKQSGAFQHSSFLHGARLAAAGLIKVKKGCLASLSPLSGHYRCTTKHFRKFVKSLHAKNVDMSHVSISRSYTILAGLEIWGSAMRGKKKIKAVGIQLKNNLTSSEDPHAENLPQDSEHKSTNDNAQTLNLMLDSVNKMHIQAANGDTKQHSMHNPTRSNQVVAAV